MSIFVRRRKRARGGGEEKGANKYNFCSDKAEHIRSEELYDTGVATLNVKWAIGTMPKQ